MKKRIYSNIPSGFTLIEVLVVLAIVGMLMGFTVPGLTGVLKGSKLTQGTDQLTQDLAVARQTAVKENVPVEFRFFKFTDAASGTTEAMYSAYQAYRLKVDANTPSNYTAPRVAVPILPKIQRIPEGMVLVDDRKWSTLLTDDRLVEKADRVRGLVSGFRDTDVTYRSFVITADGETNLDRAGDSQWYISMVTDVELRKAGSPAALSPGNFVTLQIDPFTGNTRIYQP